MKQLVIADLTKRCNDTNNRLKEFSALYDVVKNERNKYVNLIQTSHQASAEMKEKIKILQNEVTDILTFFAVMAIPKHQESRENGEQKGSDGPIRPLLYIHSQLPSPQNRTGKRSLHSEYFVDRTNSGH